MAFLKASVLFSFDNELIKVVGPTTPKLVLPFEKGITHNHTSVSKISNEIKVPSSPSGRLISLIWVKIDECGSSLDGVSKSNKRGKTLPYPLESIINLAFISFEFPYLSLTTVVEFFPSKETEITSLSNSKSTPFLMTS